MVEEFGVKITLFKPFNPRLLLVEAFFL